MFVQAAALEWCWSLGQTARLGRWSLVFQHVLSSASPPTALQPVKWVRHVIGVGSLAEEFSHSNINSKR